MSFWKDKSVLVTGSSGFVGSNMVNALREIGCKELITVRSKDYDLSKESEVIRLFRDHRPNIVIHLAGLVGGILANKEKPAEFFYQNIMINTMMMHYASRHGVKKFITAGAGCGYPEHANLPLKETSFWDGLPQKESAPYSLAKRMLLIQGEAYFRQHGFIVMVGVPGNIYGPYDNFDLYSSHVIPALVRKFVDAVENGTPEVSVWGTGKAARDFVYIGDAVRGLIRMAENYNEFTVVNLSNGVSNTIKEAVDFLVEITGFKGRVVWDSSKPEGQNLRIFDVSKAEREMGFRCEVSFKDGLSRTVEWYQENRNFLVNGRVAIPVAA